MPYFDVNDQIFVGVDEFLDECKIGDIIDLLEELIERGYITPGSIKKTTTTEVKENIPDIEFNEAVNKLSTIRHQLSPEEEELIKSIANKY